MHRVPKVRLCAKTIALYMLIGDGVRNPDLPALAFLGKGKVSRHLVHTLCLAHMFGSTDEVYTSQGCASTEARSG